jgi:hypothetical protein
VIFLAYFCSTNTTSMKQIFLFAAAFLISAVSFGASGFWGGKDSLAVSGSRFGIQNQISSQENPLNLVLREGRLQIRLSEAYHSGTVYLFDLLGNKVMESGANDNIDWSLAGLKSGVYFVVWKDGKASFTRKLLYKQEG